MAQIYKKQGNWAFRVYYFDDNGKGKSINKQGFKLKSDAQDAARELELKRARIGLSNSESATFANYFEDWIQAYRIGRRDSTKKDPTIIGRVILLFAILTNYSVYPEPWANCAGKNKLVAILYATTPFFIVYSSSSIFHDVPPNNVLSTSLPVFSPKSSTV